MPNDAGSTLADVTCTACGCLCDDIALAVHLNRIVESQNACPIGTLWFQADHSSANNPEAVIDGAAAPLDQAIAQAANLLRSAKSPLILGLTQTTLETQSLAVAIADAIGATIDPAHSASALARIRATQSVGFVSATLGEVKNRGDVIVFWGVDPVTTHPRHFERYSVEPNGRFLTGTRTVVVVDSHETATAKRADHFFAIDPKSWGESLVILRALIKGVKHLDGDPALKSLAEILKSARYGVLFFGATLESSSTMEAALKLVRDLNRTTRFVALTLGGPGNPAGIESVLTSQAGSAVAIDFQSGFPRYLPDEATAEQRLSNQEVDAALIVADDPPTFLSPAALNHLSRIPTIRIAPDATSNDWTTKVAIATATTGIHTRGTVVRSDGVALPLRPALTTSLPTDHDVLAAILSAMNHATKPAKVATS